MRTNINDFALIFTGFILGLILVQGASGEDFSIIVLPDTQTYAYAGSSHFSAQTQWIVNNKDSLNIVYVAHVGDLVENANSISEWAYADSAMGLIEDPVTTGVTDGIPFGVVPGNHDDGSRSSGITYYNDYFGVSRFSGRSYYGESYDSAGVENDTSYALFSAEGMDFIVVNICYNPNIATISWVNSILTTYSDRRAIVVSHSILDIDGTPTTAGSSIYEAIKDNANLFLMLCGHKHGEARLTRTHNGNTVEILLANYQAVSPINPTDPNGDGWLRIMTFSPEEDEITVTTYSPTLDDYGSFTTMGENTISAPFTLTYDMEDHPSCPDLYSWNGQEYENNGFIFAGIHSPQAEEYQERLVTQPVEPENGTFKFKIVEVDDEVSYVNSIAMYYKEREDVGWKELLLLSATLQGNVSIDARQILDEKDTLRLKTLPGDEILLTYELPTTWSYADTASFKAISSGYYFWSNEVFSQVIEMGSKLTVQPGKTVTLTANINNMFSEPLPSGTILRFDVEGPEWSGQMVASVSIAGLPPGHPTWFSANWRVPYDVPAGIYDYTASIWIDDLDITWSKGIGQVHF